MEFSEESKSIIEKINCTQEPLFVTGKAGTGKSTLLAHISKINPEFVVVAPTGIAAINVNGDTIHSFFKLKPGYEYDEASNVRISQRMVQRYATLRTLIIDEISMVRADLLDAIDVFLQRIKKNTLPFGGVRMIFFGDLYQLPPVLVEEEKESFLRKYATPYFFSAKVFQVKDLFTPPFALTQCELTTIYRQKEGHFTELLNAIREGSVTNEQLDAINKQVDPEIAQEQSDFQINLVATNHIAFQINHEQLSRIQSPAMNFHSHSTGEIRNLKPHDELVSLKVGSQVIFVNNHPKRKWVNGTVGKVAEMGSKKDESSGDQVQFVRVLLENGEEIKVTPFTWEISKYVFRAGKFTREQLGTFTQIPVKLAWAITIHKSQGKTFNQVKIDLGTGSFAHGQTYVALSRCRELEKIQLTQPIQESDVIIDPAVLEFIQG